MKNYVLKKWYKNKDHRMFTYPDDVDKELVPMLDVFNNIPGVRTEYCCCGHGTDGWYMSFKCTSSYMANVIVTYFSKVGLLPMSRKLIDELTPIPEFDIREPSTGISDCIEPEPFEYNRELTIVIYCNELGKMKESQRFKEYKKICQFFSMFTPRSSWYTVHEFDY